MATNRGDRKPPVRNSWDREAGEGRGESGRRAGGQQLAVHAVHLLAQLQRRPAHISKQDFSG